MEILEREQARLERKLRYYTGQPCRRGHISERYVSSGNCVECLHPKRPPRAPTAREIAQWRSEPTYDTGEPCVRGHRGLRYASTGGCIQCLNNPLHGRGRVTLFGSWRTIEMLLEYHAVLVAAEPDPLPVDYMVGGPLVAAMNHQRVLKRRKEI